VKIAEIVAPKPAQRGWTIVTLAIMSWLVVVLGSHIVLRIFDFVAVKVL
jgi:hypothetical protein